jgi:uncharacterized damage-inducible protein DinB
MNQAEFTKNWNYFRTVNGVGLRAIALLPEDKLDAHPIPGMRTAKQIVIHMYQTIRELTEGIARGSIADTEPAEKAAEERIRTKAELLQFCRDSWDAAAKVAAAVTDAQLDGTVKTPWGHDFTGAISFRVMSDEYWHHRGQLYCYLRAFGVAPHSLYDTQNNEPAFAESHA